MKHVLRIREVIMKNLRMVVTLMKLLKDFLNHFYKNLKKSYKKKKKGLDFEFDVVNFLYYDVNKIGINIGGSYIDFPQ